MRVGEVGLSIGEVHEYLNAMIVTKQSVEKITDFADVDDVAVAQELDDHRDGAEWGIPWVRGAEAEENCGGIVKFWL